MSTANTQLRAVQARYGAWHIPRWLPGESMATARRRVANSRRLIRRIQRALLTTADAAWPMAGA
ncbi:MAG: hypothetical protein RLZZ524_2917 [Pseudomonadota bacterium]|jgi:crotonobetainyl-CoA:carnitine CoA-transferase CaiB-like acyl-CoA transferase